MKKLVLATLTAGLLFGCKKNEEAPPARPPPAPEPAKPTPPAEPPKPAVDPAVLARGQYLVTVVMNCAACHTPLGPQGPDMSKLFAGGLEMPEAFGTWRSPNITQDKKTGIGDWTDEQIAAAIREGKKPSGDQLYPIMPYLFYNVLSDDDVKAVVAFLRTIPAIENTVAGNTDLKLPKIPAPKPAGTAPAADDPKAQGAYYASLMHCSQCHTPMDMKSGAPDMSKLMAGGQVFKFDMMGTGEVHAPNVTPDPETGIGKWSDDDIKNAIVKMVHKDGKPILPPMAILGMNWGKLEPAHVDAVVAWLKGVPAVKNKVAPSTFVMKGPPPGGPPPAQAPTDKDGKPLPAEPGNGPNTMDEGKTKPEPSK